MFIHRAGRVAGSFAILEFTNSKTFPPSIAPPASTNRVSRLAGNLRGSLGVHEEGDDETIKTQDFSENEDQDHANEESGLLSGTTNTSITHNADSESSSKASQTNGKTCTKLDEGGVERKSLLEIVRDQDRNNQAVDTDNTGHNDGDNVLNDEIGSQDTHRRDADARFGSAIGSTKAGEDNG